MDAILTALFLFVQTLLAAHDARALNPGNPLGTTHEPPAVERPAAPTTPPVEALPAEHPPVAATDATD